MLPRPEQIIVLISLLVLFFAALVPPAFSKEPERTAETSSLFKFYQNWISPIDGDRCAMVPSCSRYTAQCVQKHGMVMGWVMGMDRLVRCGRDEKNVSPAVRIDGKLYIHDPVENNDFWWDKK